METEHVQASVYRHIERTVRCGKSGSVRHGSRERESIKGLDTRYTEKVTI